MPTPAETMSVRKTAHLSIQEALAELQRREHRDDAANLLDQIHLVEWILQRRILPECDTFHTDEPHCLLCGVYACQQEQSQDCLHDFDTPYISTRKQRYW